MNEKLLASVMRKMAGYSEARQEIAHSCKVCGEWLEPHDTGVDPFTETRIWVTNCCGVINRYEEKNVM